MIPAMEHTLVKKSTKMIAILLVLILAGFSPGFSYGAQSTTEYIKVGLLYGATGVSECTLTCKDGFQMVSEEGGQLTDMLPISAYTTVTASIKNGMISLYAEDGTLITPTLGKTDVIMPMKYRENGDILSLGLTPYRGGIQLLPDGEKMTVINFLSTNEYLFGVLPGEMSASFPLEALKAQAVTARSYVLKNIGSHRSSGFQVCASTHCQMYKGYSAECDATNRAVDETTGQLLYANGKAVAGYYYKNSGGYTQNSEDVWSGTESYLRAVKDIYSPEYPWTATLTFEKLGARLLACGYDVGTVGEVAVTKRNTTGAVSELTVKGSKSEAVLKKDAIRTVIGGTYLKSTHFSISEDEAGSSASSKTAPVFISDGKNLVSGAAQLSVLSAQGKKTLATNGLHALGKDVSAPLSLNSEKAGNDGPVTGGQVVFQGRGYGHGVGMPQDSAKKMAEQGFTYEEILKFYYTDIEVK